MKRPVQHKNNTRSGDDGEKSQQFKKMKRTEGRTHNLSGLSRDELSIVLQYLPIESIIMLSMTSQANYEWICDHVKNHICKYYNGGLEENWSLKVALR